MKKRILGLRDNQRLIKVKNWWPMIDSTGIWWPVMLVEPPRSTVIPLRFTWPWKRN